MDKYDEIRCIGRGSYGSAHLVQSLITKQWFVVKKIPLELLSEKEKKQSHYEAELLSTLHHPNVVEYKESFVHTNVLHLVMAYCEGGDLSALIKSHKEPSKRLLPVPQILDWFIQMVSAIRHLHSRKILHRDLKTSNIFLTTANVVKLGDFGIARTLDSTLSQAKTVVGTPYFMSPEVCNSAPYSFSSDIWSLGCILYELCALEHAFDAPNIIALIPKIVEQEFPPLPPSFDNEMNSLICALLDKDPSKRPSADKILMHPYIRGHIEQRQQLRRQPSFSNHGSSNSLASLKEDDSLFNMNFQQEYNEEWGNSFRLPLKGSLTTSPRASKRKLRQQSNQVSESMDVPVLMSAGSFDKWSTLMGSLSNPRCPSSFNSNTSLTESSILRELQLEAESCSEDGSDDDSSVSYEDFENIYSGDEIVDDDTDDSEDIDDNSTEVYEYEDTEFPFKHAWDTPKSTRPTLVRTPSAIACQPAPSCSPTPKKQTRFSFEAWEYNGSEI